MSIPDKRKMLNINSPPPPPSKKRRVKKLHDSYMWCHDGDIPNGVLYFTHYMCNAFNKSSHYSIDGRVVTVDDIGGITPCKLYFNSDFTGFYCPESGQRGYATGMLFDSPDDANAPKKIK